MLPEEDRPVKVFQTLGLVMQRGDQRDKGSQGGGPRSFMEVLQEPPLLVEGLRVEQVDT